ncbi:GNAT family N-acetyltransferase [Alkalihalobacillus pseudalcaliphilus]|uniref:GNAT family N-acetyltransferase n=1 Tax=Alkalihalobacillus pseudalcaliphilus TaxID=79884 RepID=UPI00064D7AC5|nr:GNAT family N-acetyltransferase [Alkalihalobacillus pseudalcaliphilus]KMK75689.1 acetyltransferase [Alkalihalobacillus pseudalcaliphilus]
MEIIKVDKEAAHFRDAVKKYWQVWGDEDNYTFYEDCMKHSHETKDGIPSFYIGTDQGQIVATFALIRNDLNSRQDLFPWLACLYVDENYRGSRVGFQLLDYARRVAGQLGHETLFLTTDLDGYYEKDGWENIGKAFGVGGGSIKVYAKGTMLD